MAFLHIGCHLVLSLKRVSLGTDTGKISVQKYQFGIEYYGDCCP
jgi:hypothetical protein